MSAGRPTKYVYKFRDSKTGEYCTEAHALEHPATTQKIRILRTHPDALRTDPPAPREDPETVIERNPPEAA